LYELFYIVHGMSTYCKHVRLSHGIKPFTHFITYLPILMYCWENFLVSNYSNLVHLWWLNCVSQKMWFKLVCYASIFLCWLVGHPEFQNPHVLGTEGYINQETIHSSPSDQILLISDPQQGLSRVRVIGVH